MPRFSYEVLTGEGRTLKGEMDGDSASTVVTELQNAGHLPASVQEVSNSKWAQLLRRDLFSGPQLTNRELALATQELATLLNAGMPLDRSLSMLIDLAGAKRSKRLFAAVLEKVRSGKSLAEAIAVQDGAFPPLYVNMVRAGESGGALDVTLKRLAEYLNKSQAARDAVLSALTYPAILMVVAGLSLTLVLTVVLPQFEPLFREAGSSLPLSTRVVMAVGGFVQTYWWLGILLIIAGVWAFREALKLPAYALRWHRLLLRLPLLGDHIKKIETARFSRTLGTLVSNGVSLPAALTLSRETLVNRVLFDDVKKITTRLKEGGGLSLPFATSGLFPSLAIHLMRVGEETGRLDEMLLKIADIYDHEVQKTTERLLALLTPALTIGLGVTIAGIIASVLVALLSINDLVQ